MLCASASLWFTSSSLLSILVLCVFASLRFSFLPLPGRRRARRRGPGRGRRAGDGRGRARHCQMDRRGARLFRPRIADAAGHRPRKSLSGRPGRQRIHLANRRTASRRRGIRESRLSAGHQPLSRSTRSGPRKPRLGPAPDPGADRVVPADARRLGVGLRVFSAAVHARSKDSLVQLHSAGLDSG